ncbi:hypothetical protein LNV09_06980 [Paucibacter sp. B2R-40]|uniref:hypothetical protein n=1 Tax=Paucibacter sp. B2R-40 TaxID=2893554 RepID=UPI0021E40D3C|nr:hypothetical protein [Paucibacter sp. B2R-40]MCV2353909.1 hypothetical protein [Paucibacter sp. B2R-40]
MINAVSGAAEKIPAPTRPSGEESLKRRDAPQPSAIAVADKDSVVVEISSEGARRAQSKVQPQDGSAPQSQNAANAANAANAEKTAGTSTPVTQQATAAPTQQVAAGAEQASALAKQGSANLANEFDEADANQDGTVNVLERRAFDFMHPTLARYPGSADEQSSRTVAAELKAYEAVARSGRNL